MIGRWGFCALAVCAGVTLAVPQANAEILLRRLNVPRSASFCVQAATVQLQRSGYQVAPPEGSTIWAGHSKVVGKVGVYCGWEGRPLMVLDGPRDPEAEQLVRAVSAAISVKDGPAPIPGPWLQDKLDRVYGVRRLALDYKVRCALLAKEALGPLGYRTSHVGDLEKITSGPINRGTAPDVTLSCEQPGELVVILDADSRDTFDLNTFWPKITEWLKAAFPVAERSSPLSVAVITGAGGQQACMTGARAQLRLYGLVVSDLAGDTLYAKGYNEAWMVRCADQWALVTKSSSDMFISYEVDEAFRKAFKQPPPPQPDAQPLSKAFVPIIGLSTQTEAVDVPACRDAAKAVFTKAGYTPESPYPLNQGRDYSINAQRDRYGVGAAIVCSPARYGVVTALGRYNLGAAAEIQKLEASLRSEMTKPQWRPAYAGRLSVEIPRAGVESQSDGPDGRRQVLSARFEGVDYIAWELQPPGAGASDAEAALAAQTAALRKAGAIIIQTQSSPFETMPSIVVWTSRIGPDGRRILGAARFVVSKGRTYGVEVLYPDGADPAETMKRFSESMKIAG